MPPYGLVACAVAAAIGVLAVSPLSPEARTLTSGAAIVCAGWVAGSRVSAAFRTALAVVLVAAAASAWLNARGEPLVQERRTARYSAVTLERNGDDTVVALDDGLRVLARLPSPVDAGTRVGLRGRLEPFDDARNPGEPSERSLQRERGFDGRLQGATLLETRGDAVTTPDVWRARAHAWAHDRLRERLGEPQASIVAGELWGDRSALPPDLRAEFQETGTVHVLVTAGLHVGAVAALCAAFFAWLTLPRRFACALAIVAVWAFAWWSGDALPAVRAATMTTAALSARAFGRATFSCNGLALAALVLALVSPQSVATASFALSFSCVAAIFACAPWIDRTIANAVALPARAREALVLSLATQLGTWPLTAAIFLQLTPYAVAANLAVVPCVATTMALGAAQLALTWCAPLAQACANLNSWLLAWMLGAVRVVASLPGASIAATPAPLWCIATYDCAVLAASYALRRNAPAFALAAVAACAGFVLWPPQAFDGRLRITVLDVGQADSIVVQTPAGHALLVDAGGMLERGAAGSDSSAERVGERVVVPFLLRHGIHALDALVVSHPHGDHAGGCAPVLRKIRVAEIADSGQRYGGHAYRDCLDTARAEGVPVVYPRAGDEWRTGDGVTLHFLGPSLPFITNSPNDINENSTAFTLRYKSFCMLFTGDAGAAAEERFLSEGVDLRCDVLKVGHHGSAYSSTPAFISAVHPRYAIISVGRHNMFGHPAPSTIATLERIGARIYRTDENGATSIQTDGAAIDVSTMILPN
ncbi:MAG: DNA internalization-related competence protein ComEC/Rec2 [Candidatus Eremiobacteraeota bacterium]|nr:DNA internalization-related competence protein ComEC/Rec2 [Candidatus Eremiobacteraeota bacterium]